MEHSTIMEFNCTQNSGLAKEKSDDGIDNFAKDGYSRWTDIRLKLCNLFGTIRYFSCGCLFIERKIINPIDKKK